MDVPSILDLVGKLGVFAGLGLALWYMILTPRKTHDGQPRSALLVTGWQHDAKIQEVEDVRVFYEKQLKERDTEHDKRIREWRGFRDEERAARKAAEDQREQLLDALRGLTDDVSDLASGVAELLVLAKGNDPQPEATGGAPRDG
jgi:hypothetical protein